MHTLTHRFVGRITDSESAKNAAMQVAIEIGDETIDIAVSDEERWSWSTAEVTMSRVAIDRFKLELAEETLYFLPVDSTGFANDAFGQFSAAPNEPFKGWLRRRTEAAQSEELGVDLAAAA